MRCSIARLAKLVFLAWLAACSASSPSPPTESGARVHTIHVVSNGWHTAIVAPRPAVVATGLLPEAADYPDTAFLEFGWGDRVYYTARTATLGDTLRAGLISTPSVMHVAGRAQAPEQVISGSEVESLALTEVGFRQVVRAIADSFERPAGGRAQPVSAGLYPNSRFYNARGAFHLLNTCNNWTARMLRAGGVEVSPTGVITADELMARLRIAIGAKEPSRGL